MTTAQILTAAPQAKTVDVGLIAAAIDAAQECATVCTACASACLSEDAAREMATCVRDDLDCADVCATTARVLARLNRSHAQFVKSLLATCIEACVQCGGSCGAHAAHSDHCRLCQEACARCETACQALLDAIEAVTP